jgi:hypothetical protein
MPKILGEDSLCSQVDTNAREYALETVTTKFSLAQQMELLVLQSARYLNTALEKVL